MADTLQIEASIYEVYDGYLEVAVYIEGREVQCVRVPNSLIKKKLGEDVELNEIEIHILGRNRHGKPRLLNG